MLVIWLLLLATDSIPLSEGTNAGPRLYTFGGTDGGHKFNEVQLVDMSWPADSAIVSHILYQYSAMFAAS